MKLIGLTGGIGSGKSTVARFIETLGYRVYNSDEETKKLYDENIELKNSLIQYFGKRLYKNGYLDKNYFSSLIFKDSLLLDKINRLVHPFVMEDFKKWILENSESEILFMESAILFEAGLDKLFDLVLTVTTDQELRIIRVKERSGLCEDEIKRRISKQLSEKEKIERSDFVVYNSNFDSIISQVLIIINKIIKI